MAICYIVGAAPNTTVDIAVREEDFLIAADGGMDAIRHAGLTADLWLGDMDSTAEEVHTTATCYPSEKDETDLFLALEAGIDKGYGTFVIYGGLGGRLDHTIANLQLLLYLAKRGLHGYLVDETTMATALCNESVQIEAGEGMVSLFATETEAKGVTLQGLKYTVEKITLTEEFPLGVSNEFLPEKTATICVEDGTLLAITQRKNLSAWLANHIDK